MNTYLRSIIFATLLLALSGCYDEETIISSDTYTGLLSVGSTLQPHNQESLQTMEKVLPEYRRGLLKAGWTSVEINKVQLPGSNLPSFQVTLLGEAVKLDQFINDNNLCFYNILRSTFSSWSTIFVYLLIIPCVFLYHWKKDNF
jgi:hypothetical protein